MREKEVSFVNKEGKLITGMMRIPLSQEEEYSGSTRKFPIAIICHDFNQDQNWGLIVDLYATLSYAGFITLKFDFSGHGQSEGDFALSTISNFRADLTTAIDFMYSQRESDTTTLLVVGHGIGADVAMLGAADDRRITDIALIGPYFDLENHIKSYFGRFVEELKEKGETVVEGGKRIKRYYVDDMRRQDIAKAIDRIRIPIFMAHATDDTRVPIYDVRMLYIKAKDPKTIEIMDGADHDYMRIPQRKFLIELMMSFVDKWVKR